MSAPIPIIEQEDYYNTRIMKISVALEHTHSLFKLLHDTCIFILFS